MTTTTYTVTGMTCEHCVNAVTSELGGLVGVSAVTIDLVPGGGSLVTVASDEERSWVSWVRESLPSLAKEHDDEFAQDVGRRRIRQDRGI